MSPSEAARYDQYWGRKAPQVGTPNSSYYHYREYNGTIEKSKVIYDEFGRQSIRVDFSDHGMPLEHSVPHIHVPGCHQPKDLNLDTIIKRKRFFHE